MERDPTGATTRLDETTVMEEPAAERRALADGMPDRLGRYVPLAVLGAGGMGVVYAAYDTELARRVAVKVLPPGQWSINAAPRLRREARALARLTHPNVVAIYDVGEAGDTLYVAMELVEGQTLDVWLRAAPRTWTEVLDAYLQAGEGLAAAHEQGLVHRDFKPANTIIDGHGRVRVLDFGLAVAHEDSDEPVTMPEDGVSISARLTATGTIMGTPAYMAPEQIMGATADARSDQFSFCVALYEALHGVRPFEGGNPRALAAAIREGSTVSATGRRVPPWLRRAVLRGLRHDARDRWPSMRTLLRTLARGRGRAGRTGRWLAAGGLVLAGAAGLSSPLGAKDPCITVGNAAIEAWDDARRDTAQQALLDSELPYAADTWARVEPGLERYAEQWSQQRRAVCESGREGEVSEPVHDLRVACLDGRLAELRALVALLGEADAPVVSHAADAVAQLPAVDRCAEVEARGDAFTTPVDPAEASAVRTLLGHAHVQELAGRYREGLELAEQAAQRADALGDPILVAEAQLRRGMLLERAGTYGQAEDALSRAAMIAVAAHHDEVAAEAMTQLSGVVGYLQARRDEGLAWARHAQAAVDRSGADASQRAHLWNNLGAIHDRAGDLSQAREHYARALALLADGDDDRTRQDRANTLNNLGNAAARLGDLARAQADLESAVALSEALHGLDHPNVAITLANLANVELDRGAIDDAERHHRRALEIRERALGPEHPLVASSLLNLGLTYLSRGDEAEALPHLARALALKESALGPNHPEVAMALNNYGDALRGLGRAAEAMPLHRRALRIWTAKFGPEHPLAAYPATNLGLDLLEMGDPEAAADQLREALALRERTGADAPLRGISRMGLARAIEAMGTDSEQALALGQAAWDDLADAPARFRRDRDAARAWLDAHASMDRDD